ncbi:hypothetical protein CMI37_22965 [Candidatus Pacearchaeota archaeon]|nr:hypothetical protein [Candidatus Pacearchaeota archaeon]|tara:strand:- start:960 stop:1208 length:249 start_codon:yes stop_codon:yes gene_type:complete
MKTPKPPKTPEEMFRHELSSVFVRWWEESDIDDLKMAQIAMEVIEVFCGEAVEFEADFGFDDDDEEGGENEDVGFEYDPETE